MLDLHLIFNSGYGNEAEANLTPGEPDGKSK
jgi:hypothetical protein